MIIHGKAPFLECSSKGDKRFSAVYAVVKGRGRRTIEAIYQASKVFADNTTGLSIKEAKGRKPVNAEACPLVFVTVGRIHSGKPGPNFLAGCGERRIGHIRASGVMLSGYGIMANP